MTGAEYIVKCMVAEGVTNLFGYPGAVVLPLYDALFNEKRIHHIRTCHEQGAVHAADGYARATGKVGVALTSSGPGATNTITGITTAHMDSIPLVVFTGQVVNSALGSDAFQEVDITGMTMSVTKYNVLITDINSLAHSLARAFYMAKEGRPGAVLVDITKDVLTAEIPDDTYTSIPIPDAAAKQISDAQLKQIAHILNHAERPVIFAGGGFIRGGHSEALQRFMEHSGIPVCNSLMGLGSVDRNHPLSYGMVGMHGDSQTNLLCHGADVILAMGVRFSDRAIGNRKGFSKAEHIIHVDIDDSEFSKNIDSHVDIIGNYTDILNYLMDHVTPQKTDWSRKDTPAPHAMHPKQIIETAAESMPEETIVVTDVGQHQMWTAKYWPIHKPNAFISSGGLGTMGFGVGAAMGAKCGRPEAPVLLVTGDGSFRMNQHELLTLSAHHIPITVLICNNHSLGMVRQWQALFNEERYVATDIFDPLNIELLCGAYNISYAKATDEESLREAFAKRSADEILVIECIIGRDERVYPMVPAGKGINEYIDVADVM